MTDRHKILIIAPAWIGDMIMAQTLFKLLHQRHALLELHVLAPPSTYPLLTFMPQVKKAILFETPARKFLLKKRYTFSQYLKKEKYSQAIILPNSWKSAIIPFLARIPRRTGWLGESRFFLLNDWKKLGQYRFLPMVKRFAMLGEPDMKAELNTSFQPHLRLQAEMIKNTLKKFKLTDSTAPILAICPGAEYGPSKRWPPEYYAKVAKEKIKIGWKIWLIGSIKESEAGFIIQEQTDQSCLNLIGQTTLTEAVALLSQADKVISNDSGLMHVAAALERPQIAIFGSSSPLHTPPLNKKATVLYRGLYCSPCFKRVCPLNHTYCLKEITPETVLTLL